MEAQAKYCMESTSSKNYLRKLQENYKYCIPFMKRSCQEKINLHSFILYYNPKISN